MTVTVHFSTRFVGEFQPYEFGTTITDEVKDLTAEHISMGNERIAAMNQAVLDNTYKLIDKLCDESPDFALILRARSVMLHNLQTRLDS